MKVTGDATASPHSIKFINPKTSSYEEIYTA